MPEDPPPPVTAEAAATCTALPAWPSRPSRVKSVADYGAVPNDSVDDTAAIQRAINALAPGDWLIFPPGRYLHNTSLRVKQTNAVLWGDGATLHATNPSNQAIWLEADGASVYKFTLTAVTSGRRTTPWESRIAVFGGSGAGRILRNNVVRGNRVVPGGAVGTPLQNSASSAGIFIYRATNFLVAENIVSRSLADGIHVTSGSSYGKVLNNHVKETGDDMIAVVSYIGHPSTPASKVAADLSALRARHLNHHVTIAGNSVSGQYWGRGITVVGGEHITIERNSIDKTTHGAGIYLARETSYLTFGVKNVLIRDNVIKDVQTTRPAYTSGSVSPDAGKTGHGGIEIFSFVYTDEKANGTLYNALATERIQVENNTIERTRTDGVRIGTGWGRTSTYSGRRPDGSAFSRTYTGGRVGLIGVSNTRMSAINGKSINILNQPSSTYNVACSANTDDGKGASHGMCGGTKPTVPHACSS